MDNKDREPVDRTPADPHEESDLPRRLDQLWPAENSTAAESAEKMFVGKYELQQVVGAGSFGVVYMARDTELGRAVALKLPRLEVWLDSEKRKRFAGEAMLAAKLDHPQIVPIHEACLDGLQPYIASAFCDGPNLADWITTCQQKLSWQSIAQLVAEVADAVHHAHTRGILHRDLKPANILMVPTEPARPISNDSPHEGLSFSPRLTDFGLAKFCDLKDADTRSSQMVGTPLYMAPERLTGCDATAAADIYSLGVVLFELLTGKLPIDGENYLDLISKIRKKPPLRLGPLRHDAPKTLARICAKCLEKEPAVRYETAADLADDLRRCVDDRPTLGKLPTWRQRFAYWCTRPERVENAGWFAIVSHLVLAAWVAAAVLLLPMRFELDQSQWTKHLYQMLYGLCFSFGPILLFGWLVLMHHRWAIYLGFLVTLGKIPVQIRAMLFTPVYFPDLYQTGGVYVFMDHFMVVVFLTFQLFFFACAILADRKHQVCG